jgi:hypothetical protein
VGRWWDGVLVMVGKVRWIVPYQNLEQVQKNTERHRKVPAKTIDRCRKTQKNIDSQRYGTGLITFWNLRTSILKTSGEWYKSSTVYK